MFMPIAKFKAFSLPGLLEWLTLEYLDFFTFLNVLTNQSEESREKINTDTIN